MTKIARDDRPLNGGVEVRPPKKKLERRVVIERRVQYVVPVVLDPDIVREIGEFSAAKAAAEGAAERGGWEQFYSASSGVTVKRIIDSRKAQTTWK